MNRKSYCRCLLCAMERQLAGRFSEAQGMEDFCWLANSSLSLSVFPAASDLVAYLHSEGSNGNGSLSKDSVLRGLLLGAANTRNASTARELLLLVFVPMLHRLSRQVTSQCPALSPDDVAQHLVASFLESLGSVGWRDRSSHIAFAIARHLRRSAFLWAQRESRGWLQGEIGKDSLQSSAETDGAQPIERSALLCHFLDRCQKRGVLSAEDYELLVQFKLDDTRGIGQSNASRQRMKRLVGKLRRAARPRQVKADDRQLHLF